jgi:hypothetical protein
MRLEYSAPAPSGVLPPAYYVLSANHGVTSSHAIHELRHPLSTYTLSLQTIEERIRALLDLIEPMYGGVTEDVVGRNIDDVRIRHAIDGLLDALMEHFDDVENIVKCFTVPGTKEAKSAYGLMKSNWRNYRDHVGAIVNYIKHKQRRVRVLQFYGEGWSIPGYFIEGPAEHAAAGPDPRFHKHSDSAFSLRRDIAFHLCGIYFISQTLTTALGAISSKLRPSLEDRAPTQLELQWHEMFRRVSELDARVFPDETNKPFPDLLLKAGEIGLAIPARRAPAPVPVPADVTLLFTVDPVDHSYQVPYFPRRSV